MYIRVQIQLIISYQYAIKFCLYSRVLDEDFHIKLPLKSV